MGGLSLISSTVTNTRKVDDAEVSSRSADMVRMYWERCSRSSAVVVSRWMKLTMEASSSE